MTNLIPRIRPWLFLLSVVVLAVAYIPFGWTAMSIGILWPFDQLHEQRTVPNASLFCWLLFGTVLGNGQILSSLLRAKSPSTVFQNPILKVVALSAQFTWGFQDGFRLYFWHAWVIGSALLYVSTPCPSFRWSLFLPRRSSTGLS